MTDAHLRPLRTHTTHNEGFSLRQPQNQAAAETKKNGSLADEQTKAVEAGLAMHLRVRGELDEARDELRVARETLTKNAVELEAMRSFVNMLESRVEGCIAERDQAVGDRAQYEALFSIMQDNILKFRLPPPVRRTEQQ